MKLLDELKDYVVAAVPVGSRVTCNPPPTDTDQDILCLVEEDMLDAFEQYLMDDGWEFEGENYLGTTHGDFDSWRTEIDGTEYNAIITTKEKWFDAFMDSTLSCKEKNLLTKEERIAEFAKHMPKKVNPMDAVMKQMEMKLGAQQGQQNVWAANPFTMQNYVIQGLTANAIIMDDVVDPLAGAW